MGKKKSKQQQSKESGPSSASKAEEEVLLQKIVELEKQIAELNNNAAVSRSTSSFGIGEAPPEKSGYLFKWQDRSIGWGGTKWGLRYVSFSKYYIDFSRFASICTHNSFRSRFACKMGNFPTINRMRKSSRDICSH